jgi:cyclic pyranopterin phosphate synthase
MGAGVARQTKVSGSAGGADAPAFSHFDRHGNAVMVDVGAKPVSRRAARARGEIRMSASALNAVREGRADKGDVLGIARLAGIMAAKKTAALIPLCHPLIFDCCTVDFSVHPEENRIEAECTVSLSAKTGAEMEALTGAAVALLTIYDMCKALDKGMVVGELRLIEKSGGKSGHYTA